MAFAAAVTGTTNLYASIDVRTAQVFYRYLTESVVALPGLRHTATAPIHHRPGARVAEAGDGAKRDRDVTDSDPLSGLLGLPPVARSRTPCRHDAQ
ncbi:hypothetical protein [Nonomuraea montanisoli]|uniref:hypothetical protein n=1 Tax=Nonomuraea montanisoli TaxID=2741721 RepID=UPI001962D01E|nr:hypothetical protein [Nonomuraea montanisoli]